MRFGTKMMISFIVLLSLTFGFGGSLLISASFQNALERARESATASHTLILYTLSAVSAGAGAGRENMTDTLAQLDAQGGKPWVALRLSDEGGVLYRSTDFAEFDDALRQSADVSHRAFTLRATGKAETHLQIAGQFMAGPDAFYFEGLYDITSIYTTRQAQERIYLRLFIAVAVLGAAVSWLMSFLLTRPLRKLSRMTRAIASGDLSCRAEVHARDEIGILAEDFNDMAGRLEKNISELRDAMHRQEAFMGGFAHELKTPMTSIIGYADLLRSHSLSDTDRRDAANYIFTEGRRLESLSLKLLELIVLRRGDLTLEPGRVSLIVEDVVRLMKPVLYRQKIRIYSHCDESEWLLEPDLMKSLLMNLVDNARKAIDQTRGGEILIESNAVDGDLRIRVTDNGRGIPAAELSRITDAFYRVDKSRSRLQGGVGLGLSLCMEIAALHGGCVSFESFEGQGTRVTVLLKGGAA